MGNKAFDKQLFKTQVIETRSRINVKRSKQVNQIHKEKQEILEHAKAGDVNSAIIYWDTVIYEEGLLQVYDILATFLDQMKSKSQEIESYGITEDLKNGANAVVFSSNRLEVKELQTLAKTLRAVMDKVEYKEAINGSWENDIIRENITTREISSSEKWLKLIEICREGDVKIPIKENVKKDIREYCHRNQIDYPYEIESDGNYNPAPKTEFKDENKSVGKGKKEDKKAKKDEEDSDSDDGQDLMNRLNNLKD